ATTLRACPRPRRQAAQPATRQAERLGAAAFRIGWPDPRGQEHRVPASPDTGRLPANRPRPARLPHRRRNPDPAEMLYQAATASTQPRTPAAVTVRLAATCWEVRSDAVRRGDRDCIASLELQERHAAAALLACALSSHRSDQRFDRARRPPRCEHPCLGDLHLPTAVPVIPASGQLATCRLMPLASRCNQDGAMT